MELLTYNVRMLEGNVAGTDGPLPATLLKNNLRAEQILDELTAEAPDVIVLTELFGSTPRDIIVEGTRSEVRRTFERVVGWIPLVGALIEEVVKTIPGPREGGLDDSGYEITDRPRGSSLRNGGVLVASRLPMAQSETYVYDHRAAEGPEWFVQDKGIVYARLMDDDQRYHVFGTHLQHGCDDGQLEARLDQLDELARFVAEQNVPGGEPIVVAGDFNIGDGQTGSCAELSVRDVVEAFDHHGIDLVEARDPSNPDAGTLLQDTTLGGESLDHVFLANHPWLSGVYEIKEWTTSERLSDEFTEGDSPPYHLSDHHPVLEDIGPDYLRLLDSLRDGTIGNIPIEWLRRYHPG